MDGGDDFICDEQIKDDSKDDETEDDAEYDADMEEDRGDPEDRAYDEYLDKIAYHETLADEAPPIPENDMMVSIPQTKSGKELGTKRKSMKKGSKRKRGRGPAKGIKVTEPMHLEYNNHDRPCGRWRGKYGTHIGLCMRKLSILHSWSEVSEGLKKALWEDTVNLFHIQPDEAKKDVFLSAIAERFRDFKPKLVSGWITLRRDRVKAKKLKQGKEKENEKGKENKHEEGRENVEEEKRATEKNQAPVSMPYEIWDHITKDEWEAFVAKKTTATEIEKRSKASANASKKKYHHHMGPKTFEEKRKEWIEEGFYPNLSSSSTTTSSSSLTTLKVDRVADWYCSLHGRDASGRRTISDPGTRKIADAVIGWKHKEVTGEFAFLANKDALYRVLGKDHNGRVKGIEGVRLGLKKAFGEEYSRSNSSMHATQDLEAIKASIREELREEMKENFAAILERMGLPSLKEMNILPGDRLSQRDVSTPNERIHDPLVPMPPIPNLEEETPCDLLLPKLGVVSGELIVVAYGRAQPKKRGLKSAFGVGTG